MTKNIIKWTFAAVSLVCVAVSLFLMTNTAVFAACTASQTCANGSSVMCSGDNNCRGDNTGGGVVSCDNGNIRTTCYCGRPCTDTRIGGGDDDGGGWGEILP